MKLSIKTPCPAVPVLTDAGDGTSRCSLCPKRVHHLSRMTEEEGRALIARSKTEDICVQYMANRRGHVRFAPALRAAATMGFIALSPAAMADGGDAVASALAEFNRMQQDSVGTTVHPPPPNAITIPAPQNQAHSDTTTSTTSGTEPEPEDFIVVFGGI